MVFQGDGVVFGGREQRVVSVFCLDFCVVFMLYNEDIFIYYGYINFGKYFNKINVDSILFVVIIWGFIKNIYSIKYFSKILIL